MEIKKIVVEYIGRGSFSSTTMDTICHVKTLPYLSVVQAIEGNYDITLGTSPTCNTEECGFFIAPANVKQTIVHHADPVSGIMHCRWVFLNIWVNDSYRIDDLFAFPTILPSAQKSAMHQLLNRLFDDTDPFEEQACCYEIAALLSKVGLQKQRPLPHGIQAVLQHVQKHLAAPLAVEELATLAGYSYSHFFSIFKKVMGISPTAYINTCRLSAAAEALLHTDHTVGEISAAVGIRDPHYFNKQFRKTFQLSPSEYRNVYQKRMR